MIRETNWKIDTPITIGIASYNQEMYLRESIESVLNQSIPCKIILCNDGSTDNSLNIAREYSIKIIDQVNKGLPSTRNTILMNCDTEFILYLDADDILAVNAIEKIQEVINQTNADIVAPSFKTFGTTNQEVILGPANVFDFLESNRIGYFSAIRKSKLLEIGGYSPRMVEGFEDWHCWINLLDRGAKLVTIKDILVGYRVKENSMITEAEKHRVKLEAQIKKDFIHLYV